MSTPSLSRAPVPPRPITEEEAQTLLTLLTDYTQRIRSLVDRSYQTRYRMALIALGIPALGVILEFGKLDTITTTYYFFGLIFGLLYLFRYSIGVRAIHNEIQMLALRLEKVVRTASAVNSYADQGVITDLAFDLKLVEAETILRYAEDSRGFNPFPRRYTRDPYEKSPS